jgi:hypothetical protein
MPGKLKLERALEVKEAGVKPGNLGRPVSVIHR